MDSAHYDLSFNVAQLLKENVGARRDLRLHTPLLTLSDNSISPEEPEDVVAHDVNGEVKVTRIGGELLVQGRVAADVDLVCSRCLTEFQLPVQAKLEERFQPTVDVETGRPVQRDESDEADEAFPISANHEMDLTEAVRQVLLVALPMRPLCRQDCMGLCPNCGANLNEGPHECEVETQDDRWAGLRALNLADFPAEDGNSNAK